MGTPSKISKLPTGRRTKRPTYTEPSENNPRGKGDAMPVDELLKLANSLASTSLAVAPKRKREPIKTVALIAPDPWPNLPYTCQNCKDAGFVRLNVPRDDPRFGKAVPCATCNKQGDLIAKAMDTLNTIPSILQQRGCSWQTFPPHMDKSALDRAQRLVRYARDGAQGEQRGVMFAGNNQVGKTGLAYCMFQALREGRDEQWRTGAKPVGCCFTTVAAMFERFREAKMGQKTEDGESPAYSDLLRRYQKVPILILDDLGSEHRTDSRIESLFELLRARTEDVHCFTIITTNLIIDPAQDINEVHDFLGAKIYSRMKGGRIPYIVVRGDMGHLLNIANGA